MAPRNIASYADKPSKTGLGPCAHFELRFGTPLACRRAGLHDLYRLARGINPGMLLDHEAGLRVIDLGTFCKASEEFARLSKRGDPFVWQVKDREQLLVCQIRRRFERIYWRLLQNEETPEAGTVHRVVRAQDLYEYMPIDFRSCLKELMPWSRFAQWPSWHSW